MSVLRILLSVVMLKLGPEDLPSSQRLLQYIILLNILSGVVVSGMRLETGVIFSISVLNLGLLLGFSYILLLALGRQARYVQTVTALCGVGIVFQLLSWPLQPAVIENSLALLVLLVLLISWELLVIAHIFRRAIESSMISAIALSSAMFIVFVSVAQLLLPDQQ